ncbi:MAG: carbohydrate ABC transporter permease [Desulforhopalus sp.]
MNKIQSNKGWLLVLPVFIVVAFNSIVPFITVMNYSVQDVFSPTQRVFVGLEWFEEVLQNRDLHAAFFRQMLFSFCVLAIQIPLGIAISLLLPTRGWSVSLCLVLLALPLLIPWNVVGTIWQIFGRTDIGLGGATLAKLGIDYNYASNYLDAWLTVLVMDVWHWLPLVILLCYSGLRAIPDAYYQAARIDVASDWAIFRYIQLPKLRKVLVIAVLLRFMDSFMIYSEPFVLTGGGPGSSTTFLSQSLATMAIGQFDVGPAAAFSIIYFLFILLVSWVFYVSFMGKGSMED